MADKTEKKHDMRDEIYKPATSTSTFDERQAGYEPTGVVPDSGEPLLHPGVKVPEGQTTRG